MKTNNQNDQQGVPNPVLSKFNELKQVILDGGLKTRWVTWNEARILIEHNYGMDLEEIHECDNLHVIQTDNEKLVCLDSLIQYLKHTNEYTFNTENL